MAYHNSSSTDPLYLANPTHNAARKSYYGISAYPTIIIDGLYDAWPLSSIPGYFATRMGVPCNLAISVAASGSSTPDAGTLTFTLQTDIGLNTGATIHAVINESGIPGTGTFSGGYFNYGLRWNLFGANGTSVSFGSSPQTITLDMDYTIDASWDWDQLYLTTFVQTDATSEIQNSNMVKMSDLLSTGFWESQAGVSGPASLTVGPSPSTGTISICASSPDGTGTVTIYSMEGRLQETMPEGSGLFTSPAEGVYFVRLMGSDGVILTRSVVVLR